MKKATIAVFILFLVSHLSFSQRNTEPTKEDKVIAESLKSKFSDDDMAIEKSVDYIVFDLDAKNNKVTSIHKHDKTLMNLESRAKIQDYCFYDGQSEILDFLVTYRGGKKRKVFIEDEAYTSKDLFHNDTRVKYVNLNFPLKGYKYNTTITKKYKDVKYFTGVYFTDIYPIKHKQIQFEIPKWLNVELKEMNFDGYKIEKSVEKKSGSTVYTYVLKDINAMTKEENSLGPTYLYPHILILPKSFTTKGNKHVIFDSTKDLYAWYKKITGTLSNNNASFKDKVLELTKGAKTDEEKIKNIYYWVQDNIRYIAFEDGIAGFKPDEASNVYKKKYGDCKGMANLTKQMLIEAGFDARLTWIGTKRIAYDYSIPNLSVDNHMICAIKINDDYLFLDPTEKFNSYGEYAYRIQGKEALIENDEDFIIKKVPESGALFNMEQKKYSFRIEDEKLLGQVNRTYKGESRAPFLYYFNTMKSDKKEDVMIDYLKKGNGNIKLSNLVTSDLTDRDKKLSFNYDVIINNAVSFFDNTIYITLDFDKELLGMRFDERKTDYIFSYKKSLSTITTLEIPKGYKVTSLPKNIDVSTKNYDLKINFETTQSQIVYRKDFTVKNATIQAEDFNQWNETIDKIQQIYNEQITLEKK